MQSGTPDGARPCDQPGLDESYPEGLTFAANNLPKPEPKFGGDTRRIERKIGSDASKRSKRKSHA